MGIGRSLAVAAVALAVTAPSAHAATVSVAGDTLRVAGAPGEVNAVEITRSAPFGAPPTVTVRDTATDPAPTGVCTPTLDVSAVSCPAAGVTRVDAALGDQDDSFSVLAPLPARVAAARATTSSTAATGPTRWTAAAGRTRRTADGAPTTWSCATARPTAWCAARAATACAPRCWTSWT